MSFSLDELTVVTNDDSDDKSTAEGDPFHDIEVGDVTSFRDMEFQSEEMKHLLKLESPPDDDKYTTKASYSANHMFPNWIINNEDWQSTEAKNKENQISDILQTPFNQRSQEQTSTLIHWLMSVWETANLMGFKRCGAMTKVFHFLTYESGENIITEGERGLTFYIVISGQCEVHKEGIGIVAGLQKGQSFGELALTEGKDLRSATVRAVSRYSSLPPSLSSLSQSQLMVTMCVGRVELLRLHKVDYDHFVKDIQVSLPSLFLSPPPSCSSVTPHLLCSGRLFSWQRGERTCKSCGVVNYLRIGVEQKFKKWSPLASGNLTRWVTTSSIRSAVHLLLVSCSRGSLMPNSKGDIPDNIYFIIEGTIVIIKEIHIVVRNRSSPPPPPPPPLTPLSADGQLMYESGMVSARPK
jgi:hypothetical protein